MNDITIKHIDTTGYESIISAKSVSYFPSGPEVLAYGASACPAEGNFTSNASYTTGVIYVINNGGKTVAKYELS